MRKVLTIPKADFSFNASSLGNTVVNAMAFLDTIAIVFLIKMQTVLAASDDKLLTDLFDSEATRGSWNWFTKFNFLGEILNFLISFFCFVSVFAIVLQTIITLGYFCLRPFWDNVHQIKQANKDQNWLGLGGYFKEVWHPTKTSGIDSVVTLFYAFLPDLYSYSEMNDDKDRYDLSDEDTITTWFIKTFPRKVLTLLLLSMGFNGSLMKCYGMFVDGAGTFMSRVVNYNTSALVNRILDSGDNFDFSIGDDGSDAGNVREAICKKIYSYALQKTGITDASLKQQIGANIQDRIKNELTDAGMTSLLIANGQSEDLVLSEEDWGYIKYTVTCNSDADGGNNSLTIALSDVVPKGTWNTESYVHITPILKRKAPEHDYINS